MGSNHPVEWTRLAGAGRTSWSGRRLFLFRRGRNGGNGSRCLLGRGGYSYSCISRLTSCGRLEEGQITLVSSEREDVFVRCYRADVPVDLFFRHPDACWWASDGLCLGVWCVSCAMQAIIMLTKTQLTLNDKGRMMQTLVAAFQSQCGTFLGFCTGLDQTG